MFFRVASSIKRPIQTPFGEGAYSGMNTVVSGHPIATFCTSGRRPWHKANGRAQMAGDMTIHGLREPWRNRLNSSRDACDALFPLKVARINAEEKFALF